MSGVELESIPSAQQYVVAFRAVADDLADSYLEMLRVHYHAPHRTVTATQLSRAVRYQNYNSANLHYGKMGGLVGRQLGWRPKMPLKVLVSFEKPGNEWHWIMRPQVFHALEELGWT